MFSAVFLLSFEFFSDILLLLKLCNRDESSPKHSELLSKVFSVYCDRLAKVLDYLFFKKAESQLSTDLIVLDELKKTCQNISQKLELSQSYAPFIFRVIRKCLILLIKGLQ